jgi:hypothetical protein
MASIGPHCCGTLGDISLRVDTRSVEVARKYATMRAASCGGASVAAPPVRLDVQIGKDMRNSFDG